MSEIKRAFRSQASLEAEAETRDAVVPFLLEHGYRVMQDQRTVSGTAVSQAISAETPEGTRIKMRVRLCWRRQKGNDRERTYAAAQLRAHLVDGDWEGTLSFIKDHDIREGNTHTLIVQYEDPQFVFAALIPRDQLMPIWMRQRDVSASLIREGKMGRIKKNHAMNGSSPTIWLQDERSQDAHAVADALWGWSGVIDICDSPRITNSTDTTNDSFDDCSFDPYSLGRDETARMTQMKSGFPRDPRVRKAVVLRSNGTCERRGCRQARDFPGFLDVHHILGVGTSDRVWNCVALCPNCHREAHCAPHHEAINRDLLDFAMAYRPSGADE